MANAADIVVNVVAKTGRFSQRMARGSRAMYNFRRSANQLARTLRFMGPLLAGLGGGIAAGGLIQLARAGVESGDQLAKTAQKLGLTTEALAGLRIAAELTGVQTRQLDLGIQRMTRRIAEAAQGAGEAQGAIRELGLNAQDLARLSPDQQFQRIAEAFENVASQSDKVRLGFKLFDSEGVALINTLAVGAEELQKFNDEAKNLGLALDPKQLEVIQQAADSQTRLGKAFTGLSRQLGATFAPAVKIAADATASFVAGITRSLPKWAAWAAAILGVKRNLDLLSETQLRAEIAQIQSDVGELIEARDALAKPFEQQIRQGTVLPVGVQTQLDDFNRRIGDLTARSTEANRILAELGDTAASTVTVLTAPIEALPLVNAAQRIEKSWTRINALVAQGNARFKSLGQSITQQVETPTERFVRLMREARILLERRDISETTFDRYRKMLQNDLIPAIEEVEKKQADLGLTFTSALEDAIVQGREFRSVLQGIAQDILRILARRAITEPLGNFFSGLFTRHVGGSVSAGRMYQTIPGEVFVPRTAGNVVPASRVGGPAVNVNYSIDARGADEATVIARMVPLLEQTVEATKNAIRLDFAEGRM